MSATGASGSLMESPAVQKRSTRKKGDLPAPVAASTPQQGGEKAKGPNAEFEADMGELNSRLATIVDRNSGILNENKHLKETMDMEKQKYSDELAKVKKLYEDELAEARRLLDKASDEKVKIDLEMQSLKDHNKELKEKSDQFRLGKQTADSLAEQLQAKLDEQSGELVSLRRKNQNSKQEKDELTMQLTSAKSDAEEASKEKEKVILQKHQLENQLQSVREEFDMAKRVHEQELRSAKENANKSLQKTIHEQSLIANQSMATALEDIRVEHEESLRGMEGKIKESYEKKIADLDAKFKRQKELTEQKRNEASQAKALQAQANTQLTRAEKDLANTRDELRKAEAKVASQRGMADATIDELQVENSDLKKKQAELEHTILSGKEKYSCLLKEVQTYRSLLEVEENRLNITPSPVRNSKRKRPRASTTTSSSPPKKAKHGEEQVEEVAYEEPAAQNADASCAIM